MKRFEGHTTGPWEVITFHEDRNAYRIFAGTTYIGSVYNSDMTRQETKANADLIVAAPDLLAENDRLREALTPSAETKVAYMGEFSWNDRGGAKHTVPWTVVKQIMAAIREREALKGDSDGT